MEMTSTMLLQALYRLPSEKISYGKCMSRRAGNLKRGTPKASRQDAKRGDPANMRAFVYAVAVNKNGAAMNSAKVALVIGGGSGMGAGVAQKLAADGYGIAILSSSGKGEALADSLGGVGVTGSNRSQDD